MSRDVPAVAVGRTLLVWCLVGTAAAGAPVLLAADLSLAGELAVGVATGAPPAARFDTLLVACCAALLTGCLAWGWLVATALLLGVATRRPVRLPPFPAPLRRALVVACGVTAVAAVAPAGAHPGEDDLGMAGGPAPGRSVLAGLPLPERPEGATPVPPRSPRTVVVARGDALWSLAADQLGADTSMAEVDRYTTALHRRNRDVIGADPDLIVPGTRLELPPHTDPEES